jgi:hypothetical protein
MLGGLSAKISDLNRFTICCSTGKCVSRVDGPVDRYFDRSTVDSRPGQGGVLTGAWRTAAMEGAERMEWRRSPAVSAPSRRRFLKVKWGKRSGRDAELVWGKWRRLCGTSIKLHLSGGGATMTRGAAALRSGGWRRLGRPREEDDTGGGPSWAQRKNGLEDLMGHHGEVGRDGLGQKMKIKPEIIWASMEHGLN